MPKQTLWLLASLCFPSSLFAASFMDPLDGQLDMSEVIADNPYAFLPVPIILTEPAIGYGGGFFGMFLHESEAAREKRKQMALQAVDGGVSLIPPNFTVVGGAATENGTWFTGAAHRHTWLNDRIRYLGALGYANINIDIFHDFNHLSADRNLAFQSQTEGYGGVQKLQFKVANTHLYLGVSQLWFHTKIGAKEPLINDALHQVLGDSSTSSALGMIAQYDSRNNLFYPTQGGTAKAEYLWYRDGFGSDYHFNTLTLDGHYFFPLADKWTLGVAGNYQSLTHADKNLPPLARPYINMRGISRYRYQGDYVLTTQTQLMWQVTPRWSLHGFVGAGSVAEEAHDLYKETEFAYGTGFRYLIARRFGLHTGIDLAFSDEDTAFYFNVGSGF
ncbi:BamA/TamA family outer membrane protein [Vibrio aphrogenes]|uniref:BamA/TamA family outer membrane protein n=1 Tax=Vibrio aphrogenes TaxID=1891186 RepID=UPI001E468AD3|nr:BamA/TamA family outer membrane protein [Vibrio aphrogenes]